MDSKLVGSVLLIVGTSIGAGMLALPIATSQLGFVGSLLLLVGCWFVMTASAFLLLEVNLWLPPNSNIISMAKATLGPLGQLLAWVVYLSLLYSLLCAYIAGGSDLFHNLLLMRAVNVPVSISSIVFTALFGAVVFMGIRAVDYTNRLLMFVKLGAYLLLVILLMPAIELEKLSASNWRELMSVTAITVTITSFGYATIVPSLRIYFADDLKRLKKAILIGSLIPLICYAAWDAAIMGIIPMERMLSILLSPNSTSDLVNTLNDATVHGAVTFFSKLFTSICVVTSFLGVALCLTDFLADGFKLEKQGASHVFVQLLTFLPPLTIVLFFPNAFIKALQYAGIYCVILLVILPAWMAWRGRYHRRIASGFTVSGGKLLLGLLLLFGAAVMLLALRG